MKTMVKTEDAVHVGGRAALLLLNSMISSHPKKTKALKENHSASGLSKGLSQAQHYPKANER